MSIDTWRAPVARAALAAGASMVNDVSGLSGVGVADACAEAGARAGDHAYACAAQGQGFPDYGDVVADVIELLSERAALAVEHGVGGGHLIFDPGIDLAKTPAESIEVLRRLPRSRSWSSACVVAVSRKDFVGALTGRGPASRDAGTLAALGIAADAGARILRVHDVAGPRATTWRCARRSPAGRRATCG